MIKTEIFKELDIIKGQIDLFNKDINCIIDKLEKVNIPTKDIINIQTNFNSMVDNFLEKNGTINIGVIGQVKTGRSTFLNSLIFEESILPKAVTPKTASITKINYSKENFLEVEFFTKNEWDTLVLKSKQKDPISIEILKMVKDNNLTLSDYIGNKKHIVRFSKPSELSKVLEDYASEKGRYTPIVKTVTININNPKLKNICIIDTPGLNDPLSSRNNKTKQFLENCDCVFFLSRASQFLDNNDLKLLTKTIPDSGIHKLILVCSRFDDGLNDTLMDFDSLDDAIIKTKDKIINTCKYNFNYLIKDLKQKDELNLIDKLKKIEGPIIISSMCYNMSKKDPKDFLKNELKVYENLNYFHDLNNKKLAYIGNFDEIKLKFFKATSRKQKTLLLKMNSFIPVTKVKIINYLSEIVFSYEKRINLLSFYNKDLLEKQKNYLLKQTKRLNEHLDELFKNYIQKLEQNKLATIKEIKAKKEKTNEEVLTEKIQIEQTYEKTINKDSRWYNPFSWGKTTEVEVEVTNEYTYMDVENTIEQIKLFANSYKQEAEFVLDNSVNTEVLRVNLLQLVLENHDSGSENFDPAFYNFIVFNTLNNIEIPKTDLDISGLLKIISNRFYGEVKNTSDKNSLRSLVSYTINSFYNLAETEFVDCVKKLQLKLSEIKNIFYETLYNNIVDEYDMLIKKLDDKENEIQKYSLIINEIYDVLKNF